ncbi:MULTISPECIES: ribonuclease D [unclassified Pseudoclavibacter]|uniref:ribonuclease D n=1 Tax=unclassified Pseudoclavibacter TaxID=2615177 RepID=UPI000CE76611|nr:MULTISPECIES: HRDC domain-containing protein [unclassified Pseudoclavibacter]MBS3177892.1 ribonuclease D [Pseudoclavibacter sp. Marseille-Q4354]PPG29434.1 ribonuclease D [Pseudoclavibacter sp. RFBB5]
MGLDADRLKAGGLDVIETEDQLRAGLDRLVAGTGPVAVDAERASGYRYSERAYLVQLFRRGSGTLLIDPIATGSLARLQEIIGEEEWIFHAATQDLPCLRELELDPTLIFDTELAARLLGYERVGLGAVIERLLGISLEKAHSAADWSTRPLPETWLAYAALDVELLIDVRDQLHQELVDAGKLEAAREEFADILERELGVKKPDAWRRIGGISRLRSPRALAVARELWLSRDEMARSSDTAPGRLFPDRALAAVATAMPRTRGELARLKEFTGRASRTQLDRWWGAVERGLTTDELPPQAPRDPDRMPHHRQWEQRAPEADRRLKLAREFLVAHAEQLHMPVENLLTPELLRRAAWNPRQPISADAVAEHLRELGARPWQTSEVAQGIAAAFVGADQLTSAPDGEAS